MADTYIAVGDDVYTLYDHALQRMGERKILVEWVEAAMNEPDDVVDISPQRRGYDKSIDENTTIRVVVDENAKQIVTMFYIEAG